MKNVKSLVLPPLPDKRYFTIGETSNLCGVKPHVLRYWEQEFTMLKPVKRRGSRRYYQHKDVQMIRQIRELLYDKGFTISGARLQLKQTNHGNQLETQSEPVEILNTEVTIPKSNNKPQEVLAGIITELETLLQQLKHHREPTTSS